MESTFRNNGGGVGIPSTLIIENSVISNNANAGVVNNGTATITGTTIDSNYYSFSTAGGGINNGGTMYILNCSITRNRAAESGGGIFNVIGQLYLTNSTVSGNRAEGSAGTGGYGGGVYNKWDKISAGGRITVTNSTIANNYSFSSGGGIRQDLGGSLVTRNSIVAGNTSPASEVDVSGLVQSDGFNLVANPAGSSGWLLSDLLNINPMLSPLGNNGGPTLTHALLPGSPAINAGSNSLARDPQNNLMLATDQRGAAFYRTVNNIVDIGAYEANYATGPVTVSGRVLVAAGGRGISRAYVTLTDTLGSVRYTLTNPFGYYRFLDLVPGMSYTIRISHKSFLFDSPQYFTADQNRADLNFFTAIGGP